MNGVPGGHAGDRPGVGGGGVGDGPLDLARLEVEQSLLAVRLLPVAVDALAVDT